MSLRIQCYIHWVHHKFHLQFLPDHETNYMRAVCCFQTAYEWEYVRTQSDNNTVASLPESLAGYNATGAMVIQEVGFTLLENTSLIRSKQFIEVRDGKTCYFYCSLNWS